MKIKYKRIFLSNLDITVIAGCHGAVVADYRAVAKGEDKICLLLLA